MRKAGCFPHGSSLLAFKPQTSTNKSELNSIVGREKMLERLIGEGVSLEIVPGRQLGR